MSKTRPLALLLLLAIAALLNACSSAGQIEDSDSGMRIGISPAAYPVNEAVQVCAAGALAEKQRLVIESLNVDPINLDSFDFAIQLGGWSDDEQVIAEISEEKLIIILHASNPVRSINNEQIADLFSGRIDNWRLLDGNEADVALWIGLEKDEGRGAVEREILAGSPVSGNAMLASSPQHMLNVVSADVNAVGLLPRAWVDSSVRSVDSNITLPVLTITGGDLSGEARAIIACLQDEQGQSILAESYMQ